MHLLDAEEHGMRKGRFCLRQRLRVRFGACQRREANRYRPRNLIFPTTAVIGSHSFFRTAGTLFFLHRAAPKSRAYFSGLWTIRMRHVSSPQTPLDPIRNRAYCCSTGTAHLLLVSWIVAQDS